MAIVHSLAVGKSKKSAGNLTYATVKGRTIAKQKVVDVHNPNTPAQQAQRSAMATIVLFWQIWASAFKPYFTKLKPLFSAFNQFVHMNKTIMHTPGLITANQKIGEIEGLYVSSGYYGENTLTYNFQATEGDIDFNNPVLIDSLEVGDKVIRLSTSSGEQTIEVKSHALIDTEIANIKLGFPLPNPFGPSTLDTFAVIFQSKDGSKTSTAKFIKYGA